MTLSHTNMHDGRSGVALAIRVQGNRRQNRIVRILRDGTLLIQMTFDAERDHKQVNTALVELLAQVLSVLPERIEIVAGDQRPEKLVSIIDIHTQEVQDRITKAI